MERGRAGAIEGARGDGMETTNIPCTIMNG